MGCGQRTQGTRVSLLGKGSELGAQGSVGAWPGLEDAGDGKQLARGRGGVGQGRCLPG